MPLFSRLRLAVHDRLAKRPPSRRAVLVFLVAVALAAPMFWLGFIGGRMIWLLPGLGVVLLARLFVPKPFKITG